MPSRLNRRGYERLIEENKGWLAQQPYSLEREHIMLILNKAVEYEYGPAEEPNEHSTRSS